MSMNCPICCNNVIEEGHRDWCPVCAQKVVVLKPDLCEECLQYPADPPSKLCTGCQAYKEHQE